jgi:hypothetical protein
VKHFISNARNIYFLKQTKINSDLTFMACSNGNKKVISRAHYIYTRTCKQTS